MLQGDLGGGGFEMINSKCKELQNNLKLHSISLICFTFLSL